MARTVRMRLIAMPARLVNIAGTETLRGPLGWPGADWFARRLECPARHSTGAGLTNSSGQAHRRRDERRQPVPRTPWTTAPRLGPHLGANTAASASVYDRCMVRVRTNIEIEDDYLRAVMDRYGVHTKTEAVDLALRHLAGQPMSRDEALAMRGAHAMGEIAEDATSVESS